ncbi:MAG: hypothetical protein ACEQSB_02305 [Undibacterium sp.]
MNFEQAGGTHGQNQAELRREKAEHLAKLQGLAARERWVFLDLAYQLGATGGKKEVTTNFLSQYDVADLRRLSEAWHALEQQAADLGTDIGSLSEEEVREMIQSVVEERG